MKIDSGQGALPRASVLVRARNDEALVGRTLEGIFAQEGAPEFEVVVCDDASTDRTREIAARYPVRRVLCGLVFVQVLPSCHLLQL